jgi:hypothetical protein
MVDLGFLYPLDRKRAYHFLSVLAAGTGDAAVAAPLVIPVVISRSSEEVMWRSCRKSARSVARDWR